MNPYAFGVIGLRIVAVFLATEVLSQSLYTYTFLIQGNADIHATLPWVAYGLCALVGLVTWWLAKPLAARAARGLEAESGSAEWNIGKVQRLALTLIGVWLIIWALPGIILQIVIYLRETNGMLGGDLAHQALVQGIIREGVEVCIGLLLVLGASFWSALLMRVQEIGLKNKQTGN